MMWIFASSQSIILPLCQIFFAVSDDEVGWAIKILRSFVMKMRKNWETDEISGIETAS
jgi:hypothetical protein